MAKKSNKKSASISEPDKDEAITRSNGGRYEDQNFVDTAQPVWNYSLLHHDDIAGFQQGTNHALYKTFGSKKITVLEHTGFQFTVWAPHATRVAVIGDFNQWSPDTHQLFQRKDRSGIWEGFIPELPQGQAYKYHITGFEGRVTVKGDPFAHYWEQKPKTSSITWELHYEWNDTEWMANREGHNSLDAPWSVYELHLASWMRPDRNNEDLYNNYYQLTERLVPYVQEMGFTHVELMPVMEHSYDGSWGYQVTGYFAPTSRMGAPEGLMHLIDRLHGAGIGVILDWVPSHFPYDSHGLYMFDGTYTYEYPDKRKGFHPDWNSYIFNYSREEVKSFLISNAHFWFDRFHIDGMRVDAVSSLLRLDYSLEQGKWVPNESGGSVIHGAIAFIKDLNASIYRHYPNVQTIAEESTDWPGVSRPTFMGGLGFGMKWMMGWMHDTLDYFKIDPFYRKYHQDKFSFSMIYYYDENFMLPFGHDEVVHGKSPMLYKMPGDDWKKFANMRVLYTYMWTHPGAHLLFMGCEFGQTSEWNYRSELDWHLLQYPSHRGLQQCVKDLNRVLRSEPALYVNQFNIYGFEWVDLGHRNECVIVYRRMGKEPSDDLLIVLNLTTEVHWNWQIEVQGDSYTQEIFNSDAAQYGGTGEVYNTVIKRELISEKDKTYRITVNLPSMAGIILK